MKTLLHQQLAKAGEQARKLRLPPEAPLRLPAPLTEFQPFVNKVWFKGGPVRRAGCEAAKRTPALHSQNRALTA